MKNNNKYHYVSLLFRVICYLVPLVTALFWVFLDRMPTLVTSNNVPIIEDPSYLIAHITAGQKGIAFLCSMIPSLVVMMLFHQLAVLFNNYAKQEVFIQANAKIFRRLGILLFSWLVAGWIYNALFGLLLSTTVAPNVTESMIYLTISGMDFSIAITGIIVILIAGVMDKACQIHDENLHTI